MKKNSEQLKLIEDLFATNEFFEIANRNTQSEEFVDVFLKAVIALSSISGVGAKKIKEYLKPLLFSTGYQAIFDEDKYFLSQIIEKKIVIPYATRQYVEDVLKELSDRKISFIPIGHENYPKSFYRLTDPPNWIFCQGNIKLINSKKIIGIVGTRQPSKAGIKLAQQLSQELSKRSMVVLSGLAKGIDEVAHRATIDIFGETIGIIGQGINYGYSKEISSLVDEIIKNDGLIISEYLPSDPPTKSNFLQRNRLQAALSRVIIPIELSSINSGTASTIRRSKEFSTPVIGVYPPSQSSPGLERTRSILTEMGVRVFEISSESSPLFWKYLLSVFALEAWEINKSTKQDRFFNQIIDEFLLKQNSLEISGSDIQRFYNLLSKKLEGVKTQND